MIKILARKGSIYFSKIMKADFMGLRKPQKAVLVD